MPEDAKRDWKTLAQLAAAEQDPEKLFEIATELNEVLLDEERRLRDTRKHKRLLLVDDDPTVRLTLVPVLKERGFEIQLSHTVAEALRAIEEGMFELLVSDLNIARPGDGLEVVTAMRTAHPQSVIVLLTG